MIKRLLPPHPNLPNWKPFVYTPEKAEAVQEEKSTRVLKVLSPRMARKISAAYCCAACWSELTTYWHISGEYAGNYTIECAYCGDNVPGFVTRTYISYRIRENEEEYRQAKMAMENAHPFLFPKNNNKRIDTLKENQ